METGAKHVDRESQAYEKLKGALKHFCPDWDYMAIDENCPEFEACTCQLRDLRKDNERDR